MQPAARAIVWATIGTLAVIAVIAVIDQPDPEPRTAVTVWQGDQHERASAPALLIPEPADFALVLGNWEGTKVAMMVAHESYFDGAAQALGKKGVTPSKPHPDSAEHRVFALSGSSTYFGCGVELRDVENSVATDYNADGKPDHVVFDICHQGQWDAFARGAPLAGWTRELPLAVFDFKLDASDAGWQVLGIGFDGPTGAPEDRPPLH